MKRALKAAPGFRRVAVLVSEEEYRQLVEYYRPLVSRDLANPATSPAIREFLVSLGEVDHAELAAGLFVRRALRRLEEERPVAATVPA